MTAGQAGRTRGRGGLRSRDVVILLVIVLAFYLVLIGVRGVSLLGDHRWIVKGLGIGVLLLPLVGVAIVIAELRFGRATERLAQRLGEDPCPQAQTLDPDEAFPLRQAQVEAAPDDWQAWYRLAIAYADARDTPRGRRTMRKAIAMQRMLNDPPKPESERYS
jgi:hypothetical protein